jgi:hypothetical protein
MRPAGSAGLTLLEILMAGCIMAACIFPVMGMFHGALGKVEVSRPELLAGVLAAEVMDQMRLVPFAELPVAPTPGTTEPGPEIHIELAANKPPPTVMVDAHGKTPLILGTYPANYQVAIYCELIVPGKLGVNVPLVEPMARVVVTVTFTKYVQDRPVPQTTTLTEWLVDRIHRTDT